MTEFQAWKKSVQGYNSTHKQEVSVEAPTASCTARFDIVKCNTHHMQLVIFLEAHLASSFISILIFQTIMGICVKAIRGQLHQSPVLINRWDVFRGYIY